MLTQNERNRVVDDLIKQNSESNVRDYAAELKEIEQEFLNIQSTTTTNGTTDSRPASKTLRNIPKKNTHTAKIDTP